MKKIITALSATAVASVVIATAAYASGYTVNDLKNLKDAILGKIEVISEMDLTGDKIVDSFDMVKMRKALTETTGEQTESITPVTEENVKYTGRNFYENDTAWLVQSGSAVEFTVTASSAEVTIAGDSSVNNDEKYRPRYAVIVDGEVILDEVLSTKEKTVELFSEDKTRTAEVKIIHLSEANNGAVGVSGIKTLSESPAPVIPAPEKHLTIEFIGDSITCAYGVEGKSAYENFTTATENFMKSYAYLTAQKLNADYSAVSYSGHGIISGYSSDGKKKTTELVPDYYKYCGKLSAYKKEWDFSKKPNDVVVINLGTNDTSYIGVEFDERKQEFIDGYADFLETVREYNPDAYIICTLGIMGCTDEYPLIEQAIEIFRDKTGDNRITSYQSPVQSQEDGIGSDWHPSAVTQQKNAYILADKICTALGMESDQIGLDVASDATHEVKVNKNSGANQSDYFSEYGNMYWVNIVNGGTDAGDIEITYSGISLKKNGVYNLNFDISTVKGKELPIIIRDAESKKILFSDTFTGTGEQSAYEKELTFDSDCKNAEIIIQAGGTDSYNVTLYNLQLQKTA